VLFTPNLVSLLTGIPASRLLAWEKMGLLLGSRKRAKHGRQRFSLSDVKIADALQRMVAREVAERTSSLQAAEKAKSDFMRLVAHELRGPMAIARGYVTMMGDGTMGAVPTPVREALPLVETKLAEMDRLVQQMLEVARVEDGRILLDQKQLDLRSLLEEVVRDGSALARPEHEIKVSLPSHEVPVRGDRSRLLMVLDNLISNALKYSPNGGMIDCSVKTDAEWARVVVRDEGIGISAKGLAQLFTRFGRVESEATRGIPGTGLGLYVAREMARRHGGDINVESREGQGSTFTVKIPLAD
jgi:signal transduction histidine kinase